MAHAHAEQGELGPQLLHSFQGDARVLRPACIAASMDDQDHQDDQDKKWHEEANTVQRVTNCMCSTGSSEAGMASTNPQIWGKMTKTAMEQDRNGGDSAHQSKKM